MKSELEILCQSFISNRDAVGKAFRWDNGALHTVCANIFCAHGETADTERLKECRKIIRDSTGFRSKFRSRRKYALACVILSSGLSARDSM